MEVVIQAILKLQDAKILILVCNHYQCLLLFIFKLFPYLLTLLFLGQCKYGDHCTFAHGDEELQKFGGGSSQFNQSTQMQ